MYANPIVFMCTPCYLGLFIRAVLGPAPQGAPARRPHSGTNVHTFLIKQPYVAAAQTSWMAAFPGGRRHAPSGIGKAQRATHTRELLAGKGKTDLPE